MAAVLVLLAMPASADEPAMAVAAPGERRFAEAVTLAVEPRAEKLMGAVREHVAEGQWAQALDRLEEIRRSFAGSLVRLEWGRYVDVPTYVDLVLCGLPPEGLAAYRVRVDPVARPRFERAREARDEAALRRLVRDAYASSVADDALLLLGDLALERGDFAAARDFWTQLVPLPGTFPPGVPRPRLRFPDAEIPQPDVLARLVLASLLEGDRGRADDELASFAERFPEASDTIGGREGRYVELLGALLEAGDEGAISNGDAAATTFGGRPVRQFVFESPVPVGRPAWDALLPGLGLPIPIARPNLRDEGPLATHPLVWRNVLFAAGEDVIVARDLDTGAPWPNPDDTAELHHTGKPAAIPGRPIAGVPRFTLTLDGGLLYARLGSAITGRAANELGDVTSEIVCLDLERGEGNLLARITSAEVAGDSPWAFEGTPVVREGRSYVVLKRIVPQTELAVACLELEPAGRRDHRFRVVWFERLLGALEHVGENRNVVSHHLLALDGERLYLSTEHGAVAAVDVATGRPRWVVTYPSTPAASFEQASDHTRFGLLPPVVDRGLVFVAPNDTDDVLAIDAASGFVHWRRSLPDRIRHLLGVGEGRLIASGNSLWGLDADTGRVVWAKRRFDPASFGYGRGLLAGHQVWWPTREGIAVVRQRDGAPALGDPVPHWIDLRQRGLSGGNLLIANGRLIVAEPHRVTVLSPTGSEGGREAQISRAPQ